MLKYNIYLLYKTINIQCQSYINSQRGGGLQEKIQIILKVKQKVLNFLNKLLSLLNNTFRRRKVNVMLIFAEMVEVKLKRKKRKSVLTHTEDIPAVCGSV